MFVSGSVFAQEKLVVKFKQDQDLYGKSSEYIKFIIHPDDYEFAQIFNCSRKRGTGEVCDYFYSDHRYINLKIFADYKTSNKYMIAGVFYNLLRGGQAISSVTSKLLVNIGANIAFDSALMACSDQMDPFKRYKSIRMMDEMSTNKLEDELCSTYKSKPVYLDAPYDFLVKEIEGAMVEMKWVTNNRCEDCYDHKPLILDHLDEDGYLDIHGRKKKKKKQHFKLPMEK